MKTVFTYIKMEHSENVEEHCNQLLNKLSKFFDRPLKGHFTFSQNKFEHRVMLTLTGKGLFLKADAADENFYIAIDGAMDKMHRQLDKKKSKMKNHKHKHPAKEFNNVVFLDEYKRALENRRKLG